MSTLSALWAMDARREVGKGMAIVLMLQVSVIWILDSTLEGVLNLKVKPTLRMGMRPFATFCALYATKVQSGPKHTMMSSCF